MNKLDDIDVICITGGKCGSTTLRETFSSNNFKTIKCHNKYCFNNQFGYDGLIDLIDRSSLNKKVYLIDSYRTPIERKMSSFFENIRFNVPDYQHKNFEELNEIFINRYMKQIEEYESINDIMLHYGVELFSTFDFENGYIKKEKGNIVFIKILYSDIQKWGKILSNIFNREIVVKSRNVTCNKEYSNKYEEFKREFKVPISYINEIKNKDSFKVFNTQEQQNVYIDKWMQS